MSAIIDNTARNPLLVARGLQQSPVLVNDFGRDDLEKVCKILARAGQKASLEAIVQQDGVSASAKGVIASVLNQHKMNMH